MGERFCSAGEWSRIEAGLVSAVATAISTAILAPSSMARPTLRVLTLTPFYPNVANPAEGCFIAEVLPFTQRMGISNEVIAVRPFHRGQVLTETSIIACEWKRFLCVPGNLGLPVAGDFLARRLLESVTKSYHAGHFDLIHAHGALPCGYAAAILREKLGIPFVVSVHGLDVFSERQAGKLLGSWCRRVSERVYGSARSIVCISEKVRDTLADASVKTTVIHNGVDALMFSPGEEQKSPLVILSVGNLIATKGHASLLRSLAQVLPDAPDCELQIIGDGPERSSLSRLAERLGISKRVLFLGQRRREAVARAMKGCAVFALPSSYEGLGCVYLEAMASAKPAIACQGQGIDEIIEHGVNGLLVRPHDGEQLSNALRMLLRNQDLRDRIGSAARSTVLHGYTLEHQAAQLDRLYRGCVA
jgi:glycosyltransferase involved in cell wall biosynthesis